MVGAHQRCSSFDPRIGDEYAIHTEKQQYGIIMAITETSNKEGIAPMVSTIIDWHR